ncbi:hypothetical protein F8388_001848 [Cannabis sativa]|uniref:Uncharacterized protein n=1 Tax=Cannabis sativa TaxID=3483 RepID=A0A7J6E7M2_CANSA|nr:hypothetical protein G4B88_026065 [Cannabis sativa]KAF4369426.1 hypothetical protein F8388_001848 [Cannabis sativa]
MSRPFSSSKLPTKPSPSPASSSSAATTKTHRRKKKNEQKQSIRNPLQNLNAAIFNTTVEPSSSISIEAPRGCLKFFLSHSSAASSKMPVRGPLSHSGTHKSAPLLPTSKPSKSKENQSKCNIFLKNSEKPQNPISTKVRKNNSSCLYQWQSTKKPRSTAGQQPRTCSISNSSGVSANEVESGSVVKGLVELEPCPNDETLTPLNKIASGSRSDCRVEMSTEVNSSKEKSKTPPIQASVSPEIQCGSSSVVSTNTPACYGAGHVVSGITDKRKCRPRGLLAVGENDSGFGKGKALGSFDYDDDEEENVQRVCTDSDAPLIPLPSEASMHWLLSPCSEEDKSKKDIGSCRSKSPSGSISLHCPFLPSSSQELYPDVYNTAFVHHSRKNISTNSPGGIAEFRELLEPLNHHSPLTTHDYANSTLNEERKCPYYFDGENSPFSMDSLGSGNVILTPRSDLNSHRFSDLIQLSTDGHMKSKFDYELNSVVESLRKTSLSPNNTEPNRDSIDFSFQFDSVSTSCSSVYFNQFKQILDDQASWNSCSTLENVSQSQMRISWRDGLMSQIHEMDEFDCCRCLSDEEEDVNGCSQDQLLSGGCLDINANMMDNQCSDKSDCWSAEILDTEQRIDEKGQDYFNSKTPLLSYSCAESISTDGGGLLASADSEWDFCYKNDLFQV